MSSSTVAMAAPPPPAAGASTSNGDNSHNHAPLTKLKAEDLLLLEQSTLKTPTDALRKVHKLSAKTTEHNLATTSTLSATLSTFPSLSPEAEAASIDTLLSRMRNLKRKLSDISAQSTSVCEMTQSRLSHLTSAPDALESPSYSPWARKRLSLHLADYFLRASPPLRETAEMLCREEHLAGLVDFEVWSELAKAEKGINEGRLDEVLAWVAENKSALRKMKSSLEFEIHLQSFIELCRQTSHLAAITYSRTHLSPLSLSSPGHLTTHSTAMSLLAYPPTTTCPVYARLYSPQRWEELGRLFRGTFLKVNGLSGVPLLSLSLQAGLASLKTPSCIPPPAPPASSTSASNTGTAVAQSSHHYIPPLPSPLNPSSHVHIAPAPAVNPDTSPECPICSSPLSELAKSLPYSHHVNSTIVCRLTGKLVEGGGASSTSSAGGLLAIVGTVPRTTPAPSGRGIAQEKEGWVYSREGLELRVTDDGLGVWDPRKGEREVGSRVGWEELKKVYIS